MMHFHKSPLILGIIEKTILGVLKFIYWLLGLVHLRITFLLAILGIILHFTNVFAKHQTILTVYSVLLTLSIVYALVRIIYKLTSPFSKKKKANGIEIIDVGNGKSDYGEESGLPDNEIGIKGDRPKGTAVKVIEENYTTEVEETPTYYKVNGYRDLLMAEYSDKVVLYRKTEKGYIKVRTDYKGIR